MLTARNILDTIDAYLVDPDVPEAEKKRLWAVLTALRGPDSATAQPKDNMTAPIRGAALPRCFHGARTNSWYGDSILFYNGFQIADPKTYRFTPSPSHGHFDAHCNNAAQALGL